MYDVNKEVTFLLVEDDDVDIMTVQRAMKKAEMSQPLWVAKDGLEAIEVLKEARKRGETDNIIVLLDLNMPRMNGHEFLAAIRGDENLHPLVVFVLTSSAQQADVHRAYEKNVAGYIIKQDSPSGGLQTILRLLDNYGELVKLPSIENSNS